MREEICGVWGRDEGEEVRGEGGKVSDDECQFSQEKLNHNPQIATKSNRADIRTHWM